MENPSSLFVYKKDIGYVFNDSILLGPKHIEVIAAAICSRAPGCNMLVFGCGHDSIMWHSINYNGYTLFMENIHDWAMMVLEQNPQMNIALYDTFGLTVASSWTLQDIPNVGIPEILLSREWDVILIDGPAGFRDDLPGRALPIWWSAQIRKRHTHVFIDDYERRVEHTFSNYFFEELLSIRDKNRKDNTNLLAWSVGIANGLPG